MGLFRAPKWSFLKLLSVALALGIFSEMSKGEENEIEVLTPSDFNIAQGRTVSALSLFSISVLSHGENVLLLNVFLISLNNLLGVSKCNLWV